MEPRTEQVAGRFEVPGLSVPPYATRLVLGAAVRSGLDPAALARVQGLSVLDDDRVRIPSSALVSLWEEWSLQLPDLDGAHPMRLWQPGELGVWGYLISTAPTLTEGFRVADRHVATLTDPDESFRPIRHDAGLTIVFHCAYREHPLFPLIGQFALGIVLTAAGAAAGRPLAPIRIRLTGPAPRSHRTLIDTFGTRNLEFEAAAPAITFSPQDADAPLPHADPALAALLADQARLATATAQPVLSWLDRFRAELVAGYSSNFPELAQVAGRLGMAQRTLQRRLGAEGTSWREELELARRQRVERLLLATDLTVESIATRTGYADVRALRRAIHRWYGHGPADVRRLKSPARRLQPS
ncbi:AraC family transcriptional regulator [Streptomyces triticagri]|nr:AraC family transcriptional regulator [Streptomyces triticagri]